MEIVLASLAGVAIFITWSSLYLNKIKTKQRQNGLFLPVPENTKRNSLADYEDGYDLPDESDVNPDEVRLDAFDSNEIDSDSRQKLLYGRGKKSKKYIKKSKKYIKKSKKK